jgi:hypothetical protein
MIEREFWSAQQCQQLLNDYAQDRDNAYFMTMPVNCADAGIDARVVVVTVGDDWQFASELRVANETKQFRFIRLTDAGASTSPRANVLAVSAALTHCNVGDALLIPDSSTVCAVRCAHVGATERFAVAFPITAWSAAAWPHFEPLPLLVKETILSLLNINDLLAVGCVSRRCRALVDSNVLWRERVRATFGAQAAESNGDADVLWRRRFGELVAERRNNAVTARHRPVNPLRALQEWADTEGTFVEHLVNVRLCADELVRRGFVWLDCQQQLYPLHVRFAADLRQFAAANDLKRAQDVQVGLRAAATVPTAVLACRWLARVIALTMDPTWRSLAADSIVAFYRLGEIQLDLSNVEFVAVRGQPGTALVARSIMISRFARYRLYVSDIAHTCHHAFVRALAALAQQSLTFLADVRGLTDREQTFNRLLPKRRLSEFVAVTSAVVAHEAVQLLLLQCELVVVGRTEEQVLPLHGAIVVARDDGVLCVQIASGQRYDFEQVAAEFVASLQDVTDHQ